ncbi:MAG TPA: hypothetical protein VKM72_23320, partial [Thermoanaerobaculia bacterium]|nr:hypothetical protein [Thermoanaerobaculia bacterium]
MRKLLNHQALAGYCAGTHLLTTGNSLASVREPGPGQIADEQLLLPEVLPPLEPALTLFGGYDADPAPDLCFFARAFVATTLPHKRPSASQFTRECHFYTLSLTAPEEVGLPYGRL